MMKKTKNQGAVSIILAISLLSMLLAIGMGISALMFQQMKLSKQTGQSVVAFYAADAGAEKCLYQVREQIGIGCDVPGGGIISEEINSELGISYKAEYDGLVTVKAIGQFMATSRGLQLSW